jgi:ferric-dicitrate binding protein FerR (iron transport regulator)
MDCKGNKISTTLADILARLNRFRRSNIEKQLARSVQVGKVKMTLPRRSLRFLTVSVYLAVCLPVLAVLVLPVPVRLASM